MVEKLGDLSKIDISAEVTKLLTSMSQGRNQFTQPTIQENDTATTIGVQSNSTPPPVSSSDPRAARTVII